MEAFVWSRQQLSRSKTISLTSMSFYAFLGEDSPTTFFQKRALQNLIKCLQQVEDLQILADATLLDPRVRNRSFLVDKKGKYGLGLLLREIKEAVWQSGCASHVQQAKVIQFEELI